MFGRTNIRPVKNGRERGRKKKGKKKKMGGGGGGGHSHKKSKGLGGVLWEYKMGLE